MEAFANLYYDGELKKGPAYKEATGKQDLAPGAANIQANRWLKRDNIKERIQELADVAEFDQEYRKLDAEKNIHEIIKQMMVKVKSSDRGATGAANTILRSISKLEEMKGDKWNDSDNNEGSEQVVVNIVNYSDEHNGTTNNTTA